MQGPEANREPGDSGGSVSSVDIVVIGHVGISVVRAGAGCWTSPGGSGYAVAASAAALIGGRVGLVAQVGAGFDLTLLRRLQTDLDGVMELPGPSAELRIDQFDDGRRSFSAELGVAATVRLESFPSRYLNAACIHLGTAPPAQQLTWLRFLRDHGCAAQISADMFEHYVANDPGASHEVCDKVDLTFMNQAEHDGLYGDAERPVPKAPLIVKRGPAGARLLIDGLAQDVAAEETRVVDPTGGGEVLAGVFLALCAAGWPQMQALQQAVKAATSCVGEFGVSGPRLHAALEVIRHEVLSVNNPGALAR
jgi:sugar/nucleoside kinase (ribokinase family)